MYGTSDRGKIRIVFGGEQRRCRREYIGEGGGVGSRFEQRRGGWCLGRGGIGGGW